MIYIDLVKAVKKFKQYILRIFIRGVCEPTAQSSLTIFEFMLIRWHYAITFY